MQRKIAAVVLLIFLLLLITPQPLLAETDKNVTPHDSNNKVVFILMDNITWSDIIAANDPILNNLIKNSSIGLLNNRTAQALTRSRSALTVGTGVRAGADPTSFEEFNADEPYGDDLAMTVFKQRTGKTAKPGQVLELGIAPIIKANENGMQDLTPGDLGSIIRDAGKKTAVIGNSDTALSNDPNGYNREAVDIAMDKNGIVDYGDVGKGMLKRDPNYPFGVKTDYRKLGGKFKALLDKTDFIVVDLGDTARADFYEQYAFKRVAQREKIKAIHAGARFIKQAMETAGDNTTFIVASLSPPGSSKQPIKSTDEQLTPIIVHGPGFRGGGLISGSTQRKGIVTSVDIAPTVLSILGLPKGATMVGTPMQYGGSGVNPESLNSFNLSAVGVKDTRRTAILAYIYIQVALYVLAALVLAYRKMLNKASVAILETLIFMAMGFPLFSFYTTKLEHLASQDILITLLTIGASLVFAIILMLTRRKALHPIIGISAITLVVLSVDALLGAPSFVNSIFGYDPIRGSRFFGVGNEAMSILIANALLVFGILLEKAWNKWTILVGSAVCVLTTVIIGFPTLGANTGGIIAAVAAFTAMLLQAIKSKAKVRNAVIVFAVIAAVSGLFIAYDVMNGAQTHMGRTVEMIASGGLPEIVTIATRKLSTNLMILRYSTWSYFLLITLGVFTFLWFRPAGVLRGMLANYQGISVAITASIIGGIFGFAFNDSGVLIPAIIMSYIIPAVIYLMLWERYHSPGKSGARSQEPGATH